MKKASKNYLAAFRHFVLVFSTCVWSQSGFSQGAIQLNQLGFLTQAPKVAVITSQTQQTAFFILCANLKDTAYRGSLSNEKASAYSSLRTRIADFSPLTKKGSYVVFVPGLGHSEVFSINDHVYHEVGRALLKSYYFQRMSMALEPAFAGRWARPEGHPDSIVYVHPSAADEGRPAGTIISCPGGWYDAGDYNKYIVNSGISMGTLMSAYEDFPAYFDRLRTNIPETGNGVPDLLNEVVYNLRWELTMQDRADGGVYHKCTNAVFDPMVMPDKADKKRYVVQKSTAATLDFAAVASQASRNLRRYGKQFPGLADSCIAAAKKAWTWARKHPAVVYDQREMNKRFEPLVTTGDYGDRLLTDEWFWAAAELFVTSGNKDCFTVIREHLSNRADLPSWSDVTLLGYYSMLRFRNKQPPMAAGILPGLKDSVLRIADRYLQHQSENAFQTVMGQSQRDFIWGSNAVAANQGILLINAYLLTKDKKYLQAACSNVDYLFGRNATSYCFVTGFGMKSPMHPHHRPSVADNVADPVPGLLVGGPNPGRQDHCHYEELETETSYVDSDCAYACNEVAINWNAPAVYLVNAVMAVSEK